MLIRVINISMLDIVFFVSEVMNNGAVFNFGVFDNAFVVHWVLNFLAEGVKI